jgi:hypothetical protein
MEVDAYADSSFLLSLLRVDSNHEAAMRYRRSVVKRWPTIHFIALSCAMLYGTRKPSDKSRRPSAGWLFDRLSKITSRAADLYPGQLERCFPSGG